MNTSITLLLDKRRPKSDGRFPLLFRIIHNRTTAQITLGIYLLPNEWNEEKRIIKPSYKGTSSVTRLTNILQKKKTDVSDFINKLDDRKELLALPTANHIKELYEKKHEQHSVFSYMQKLINEFLRANRIGNARSYKCVLGILKTYLNDKDISFFQLNYAFLIKFETDHYAKGNKTNSLAVYMRTIRATYNRAIKDGLVEQEFYPFKNYSIKTTKTQKRAISISLIRKIEELELAPEHPLYHARNYFLMSFYMRGMPFADLAHLKMSNIIDGRILYDRQKTEKPYNIKITDSLKSLLEIYTENKNKDDYVFSIIHRESVEEQYYDVDEARRKYNRKLKKLAKLCGINENLTSYVGRHSFATQAKNLGVPIANISDMLGHESIKTTQIYLDTLPSDEMDKYHEQIINSDTQKI